MSCRIGVTTLCLFLSLNSFWVVAQEEPEILPDTIEKAFKNPGIQKMVVLSTKINPFYLRGDFDADGTMDYAVAVKGVISGKMRVLICAGNHKLFLLGSEGNEPIFSDMPADNFFGTSWMVFSKGELKELSQWDLNVPNPFPKIVGEAIAMIWEDGISLIYWNGSKFAWAGSKQD